MNVGWGITGAGDFLFETFNVLEKIAEEYTLSCYLSRAGERVVHIYGLWERLNEICPGGYYREVILERDQGPAAPLSGRFQTGRYGVLVVSPASSNTVAKAASGIADTLVTNTISHAIKGKVPVLMVPTEQKGKRISRLPTVVDRNVCENRLGVDHEECQILEVCPYGAIVEVEGLPKIDLTKCEGCEACVKACPYGAVSFGEEVESTARKIDLKNVEKLDSSREVTMLKSPSQIPEELEVTLNPQRP